MTIAAMMKKIMGPELERRGFRYGKSGMVGMWGYYKETEYGEGADRETKSQGVAVQKSQYSRSPFASLLFLNIMVNGGSLLWRPEYTYRDEAGLSKVLERFLKALKDEGFEILERESVPKIPKSQRTTTEDEEKLFNEHENLYQKFMRERNLSEPISEKETIEIIQKEVQKNKSRRYPDNRDIMLELAAFYGTQLSKYRNEDWKELVGKTIKICEVGGISVLSDIHSCWYWDFDGAIASLKESLSPKIQQEEQQNQNYKKYWRDKITKLSNESETLCKTFMERIKLSEPISKDEAIEAIRKEFKKYKHLEWTEPWETAILELSAFYCEQMKKYKEMKWEEPCQKFAGDDVYKIVVNCISSRWASYTEDVLYRLRKQLEEN